MAKQSKAKPSAASYVQNIAASNVAPMWTNYWNTTGSASSPNIAWQGTTSGATYSAASSVLTGAPNA